MLTGQYLFHSGTLSKALIQLKLRMLFNKPPHIVLILSLIYRTCTVHEHSVWLHVCMHGIKYLSLKSGKLIYRLSCHLVADVLLSAEHSKS